MKPVRKALTPKTSLAILHFLLVLLISPAQGKGGGRGFGGGGGRGGGRGEQCDFFWSFDCTLRTFFPIRRRLLFRWWWRWRRRVPRAAGPVLHPVVGLNLLETGVLVRQKAGRGRGGKQEGRRHCLMLPIAKDKTLLML